MKLKLIKVKFIIFVCDKASFGTKFFKKENKGKKRKKKERHKFVWNNSWISKKNKSRMRIIKNVCNSPNPRISKTNCIREKEMATQGHKRHLQHVHCVSVCVLKPSGINGARRKKFLLFFSGCCYFGFTLSISLVFMSQSYSIVYKWQNVVVIKI